jgi:hypothetical protein
MNHESQTPPNSIPALLRDLRDETTTLLRQEVALAKTELKDNVSKLTGHVVKIAIGGFVAYAGVIVLLIGLGHLLGVALERFGMSENIAQWMAPAIVGLVVALIGWGIFARARNALKHDGIAPRRTVETLRTNKEWARSKFQHSS